MTDSPGRSGSEEGPIFVVGSMRSGSTLLRLMLDSHEAIAIPPETGFMGALSATRKIPNFKYGDTWFERIGWSAAELDDRLRDFYAEMFSRYAIAQGKSRWGEKTPSHTWHLAAMSEVFPDAQFVAIVRHPGAVAASLRDRFHYTFADGVAYWDEINRELLRRASELGPRILLCRYEDLVHEPEAVLRPMLARLGVPWSASVLAHHEVQAERGSPRMSDGSTISRDSVDPERASTWVSLLTDGDREVLMERAGPLADLLGYDVKHPVTGPGDDPLRDGVGIAAQLADADFDLGTRRLVVEPDADPVDLARRLDLAEAALARLRRRRIVRLGDAVRRVQRNRSLSDLRDAFHVLRERPRRP